MRLLACLIVAPQRGYDEPAILSYAISSFCPTSADGLQPSWPPQRHLPRPHSSSSSRFTAGASEPGILVAVVPGNFLHEHHDPAPQGGIINSHERFDQPYAV